MVETVAASHIVGVLLSKRLELGAIGMAQAGCGGAEQQCEPKADETKLHDSDPVIAIGRRHIAAPRLMSMATTFLPRLNVNDSVDDGAYEMPALGYRPTSGR